MKLAKADLGPPVWATLDEAVEWLTERTGRAWSVRDVLNAALRYPIGENPDHASNCCTAIGVALPHGYSIEHAVLNVGEGRAYLEKLGVLSGARKNEQVIPIWPLFARPVALLQTQVRQLLESGWVEVATARDWDLEEREIWKMNIVNPPFIAKPENTGIPRRCLVALAERYMSDNPAVAVQTAAPCLDAKVPPLEWSLGIRLVAWNAAVAIKKKGDKLTAQSLEQQMLDSGKVDLQNNQYRLKSTDASLSDRQMKAAPKTIAGWVTELKRQP